jgi:hypothetical protein
MPDAKVTTYAEEVRRLWPQPPKLSAEEILAYESGLIDGERAFWGEYVAALPDLENALGDEAILFFGTPNVIAWAVGHILYGAARLLDGAEISDEYWLNFEDFCSATCLLVESRANASAQGVVPSPGLAPNWASSMPAKYFEEDKTDCGFSELTAPQRALVRGILLKVVAKNADLVPPRRRLRP